MMTPTKGISIVMAGTGATIAAAPDPGNRPRMGGPGFRGSVIADRFGTMNDSGDGKNPERQDEAE
jgi:hypothetical protein